MSRQFTRDFLIEVAKGNIPGHSATSFIGVKDTITTTFETVWDIAGDFVFPTGDEAWEILSDNVNDNDVGTGVRTVLITGLDTNFDEQTEVITMNGTTPVATVRTDWNRINNIIALTSGSSEWNEGTVTLRVVSGGLTRATMRPTLARSFNGFFTVPNGKVAFSLQTEGFTPKGEDVIVRFRLRNFGSNTFIALGDAPTYQSQSIVAFRALSAIPEKADVVVMAQSSNVVVNGTVNTQLLIVDENLVSTSGFATSI